MLLTRRLRRKIAVAAEMFGKAAARSRIAKPASQPLQQARPEVFGDLSGRRIVITGGSRGIGLTLAEAMVREGARVALVARSGAALANARIKLGEGTAIVEADLTDPRAAEAALNAVEAALGGIDILINNAGISGPLNKPMWEMDEKSLEGVLEVNLAGAMRFSLAAMRRMAVQGRGRIVNVSTGAVERATPGLGAYAISKHGLEGLTEQLAAEAGPLGIGVTTLRLGSVRTRMTETAFGSLKASLLPEPESLMPAFLALLTAPVALISGRCFAAWRLLSDPEAELYSPSPMSQAKLFSYPVYSHNGRIVDRTNPDFRIFDRAENRFGPAPEVLAAVTRAVTTRPGSIYPDESHSTLRHALSAQMGLTPDSFAIGNGSWEVLDRILEMLTGRGDQVVAGKPGWFGFNMLADKRGLEVVKVPMRRQGEGLEHDLQATAAAVGPKTRLIYLISPSNPEGVVIQRRPFLEFLAAIPDSIPVLMDEAYSEFIDDPDAVTVRELMGKVPNPLVGLRTFSKFYALASARVGFAYGDERMIRLLERGERIFNISHLSEVAAVAALGATEHQAHVYRTTIDERRRMTAELKAMRLKVIASQAPYMLVELPDTLERTVAAFAEEGIFLGEKSFYKQQYILFPIAPPEDNSRNLAIMARLAGKRK